MTVWPQDLQPLTWTLLVNKSETSVIRERARPKRTHPVGFCLRTVQKLAKATDSDHSRSHSCFSGHWGWGKGSGAVPQTDRLDTFWGNVLYLYGDVDSVGKYTSANSANRVLKSMPPTVPKNYTSV